MNKLTQQQSHREINDKNMVDRTVIICAQLDLPLQNYNQEDKKELKKIFEQILMYPSSELAITHQNANRLGTYDLLSSKKLSELTQNNSIIDKQDICPCCAQKKQTEYIDFDVNFHEILHIGFSTVLFFNCFKNYFVLMLLCTLIYSAYNLATNVMASSIACQSYSVCKELKISLGGKQLQQTDLNDYYYMIQSYLGIGLVVVWGIYFFYMNYRERKLEVQQDKGDITASDFTLLIQNMPNEYDKQKFQDLLNTYQKNIETAVQREKSRESKYIEDQKTNFFKVVTFNIAKPYFLNTEQFKDEELQQLIKKFKEKLEEIRGWITDRINSKSTQFKISQEQRIKIYKDIEQIKKQITSKQKQLLDKYIQKIKIRHQKDDQLTTNTVFVTFRYTKARQLVEKFNQYSILNRIRQCCGNVNSNRLDIKGITISRAPEPQDIYWTNIGVPLLILYQKKILTFAVTVLMLCASFGMIYGLSILQVQLSSNSVISFIISIVVTLINLIIGILLQYLTAYQMNFTKTNYQRSLAVKTILAQLVNTIVVTFLADRFVKLNVYQKGGLSDDVFYIGLSNAFVTPLLKILDPAYFLKKILIKWYDRPQKKLQLTQADLSTVYLGIQFEIGYQYVYLVKTCIFTVFFVSLQPILSCMAMLGFILMYHAQKWVLLKRACRPAPGSNIINSAMNQLIYLCPMIFALGNLTWPIFLPGGTPYQAIIPNMISLGIAIFFFIFPLQTLFGCLVNKESQGLVYQEMRIFLSTQYDRLNPETAKEGTQNFFKYFEQCKNKKFDKNDQDAMLFQQQIKKIALLGMPVPQQQIQMGVGDDGLMVNLFKQSIRQSFGQQYNSNNPLMIMFNPFALQQMRTANNFGNQFMSFGNPYGNMTFNPYQNQIEMPIIPPPRNNQPIPPPQFSQQIYLAPQQMIPPPVIRQHSFNQGFNMQSSQSLGFNNVPPGFQQQPEFQYQQSGFKPQPGFQQEGFQHQQPGFQQYPASFVNHNNVNNNIPPPNQYGFYNNNPPPLGFYNGPQNNGFNNY